MLPSSERHPSVRQKMLPSSERHPSAPYPLMRLLSSNHLVFAAHYVPKGGPKAAYIASFGPPFGVQGAIQSPDTPSGLTPQGGGKRSPARQWTPHYPRVPGGSMVVYAPVTPPALSFPQTAT
jgi:hypothetical protein